MAILIYETCCLKSLLVHDNRILGRGGADIATAIKETNDLQILDISFNTIGGGTRNKVTYPGKKGLKIEKDEQTEDPLKLRALSVL